MGEQDTVPRPDLADGVAADALPSDGMLLGRVGDEDVILARSGDEFFAVGAHCTHYHGALADGLIVDGTVRCPLHHACFSLTTGEALRAPALDPIACWNVERRGDTVFVREKRTESKPSPPAAQPRTSIVIVGGGAAALAAADMLRRGNYDGPVTMISADRDPPVDRPNLSKDFLAGEAQDDWIPLWPASLYQERGIELLTGSRVVTIDVAGRAAGGRGRAAQPVGAALVA